jgi:predicted nucleotidyltransferase
MSRALIALLGSETKVRVLDVLLAHPDESFHLRGLAQAAHTDSGNTSKTLRLLVESGLVLNEADSRAKRYRINPRSPLTAGLREMFRSEGALVADLRQVAQSMAADYVGVYGSMANGTDDEHSDVDVLVVADMSAVDAQAAFKPVSRTHGRAVHTLVVSKHKLHEQLAGKSAFWSSLEQDKKIDLQGEWNDIAIRQGSGH